MTRRRDEKREAPISYRPPARLRDEFHARVEKSGLSVSGFITKSVFGEGAPRTTRRPPLEQQTLARLLAEAARIRTRLDQLAPEEIAGEQAEALAEIQAELSEIRAALLTAMERKP